MDFKTISWVCDMYQRFESLCVEVEENMYQDSVKYVEDQMPTVGASVKKFYSDFMQDLLPQSSLDTVKEENPLLTVVHLADVEVSKKPKAIGERNSVSSETAQLLNDSDIAAHGDDSVNIGCCRSSLFNVDKPYEPTSHYTVEQCGNEVVESRCAELDLPHVDDFATEDLINRGDSECEPSSDASSLDAFLTKDSAEAFTHIEVQNRGDGPLCGLSDVSLEFASVLEVSYSEDNGMGITYQMTKGNRSFDAVNGSEIAGLLSANVSPDYNVVTGTSNSLFCYEVQNGDADKQGVRLDTQLDKVKLGESCVLVEKNAHSFMVPLEHERKSYKKKIRNVFTPRRWSRGEQDKQQLTLSCEEPNVKNYMKTHVSIKDSQLYESLESEWELL